MLKQRKPPLGRNDTLELTIDTLGAEGQGIGRYKGYAVFVPFALPGETVQTRIIKATSSYAVGKLVSISKNSPSRVDPPCPHFGRCGGCTLMHLSYSEQLSYKRDLVASTLTRLGGFRKPNVLPALGMNAPYSYRNKGSFPFANVDGRAAFGFFAPRSHRLIPLSDCAIQKDETLLVAETVCGWANEYGIPAYDETTHTGALRHVMARVSEVTGEVMAVVVTNGKLLQQEALIERLRERVPGIVSIVHNQNDKDTNVILGAQFKTIWGKSRIADSICGLRFSVSAASFLQVNPQQTEKLYRAALDALNPGGGERIADVYCGIGTISLLLAQHAGHVDGIESVPEAVEDAIQNARGNGIDNLSFHCGNAEEVLPQLVRAGLRPDAVVLDPPRKGCERPVLDALLACGAERIVYVSCNPATLARDARILADGGFHLISAQPVDMFPQTSHVETVVLLSKGEIDSKKVRVEFSLEDMDMSGFQKGATYEQIKAYVLEHTGLKVSSLYISQIKRKCGLDVGQNYNLSKKEDAKVPKCPPEKEAAIRDALKYFQMI